MCVCGGTQGKERRSEPPGPAAPGGQGPPGSGEGAAESQGAWAGSACERSWTVALPPAWDPWRGCLSLRAGQGEGRDGGSGGGIVEATPTLGFEDLLLSLPSAGRVRQGCMEREAGPSTRGCSHPSGVCRQPHPLASRGEVCPPAPRGCEDRKCGAPSGGAVVAPGRAAAAALLLRSGAQDSSPRWGWPQGRAPGPRP